MTSKSGWKHLLPVRLLPAIVTSGYQSRNRRFPTPWLAGMLLFMGLSLFGLTGMAQRSLTVRTDRWLSVRQVQGQVIYQRRDANRPARRGDRLQSVGDTIVTGKQSMTTLEVDTGVGFVRVAENTELRVRSLQMAPDNGRITHLEVPKGQVKLQVRRFTHRGSSLEIQTPAGVSAVRGTEFGIGVQPDGKMGVATHKGGVATTAQGRTILVSAGFQNLTIPGEAPLPAVPLRDSTALRYRLDRKIEAGVRGVRLIGQVDPVNVVLVADQPQVTDRNGQFSLLIPAIAIQSLQVTVVTPLGRRQVHNLTIRL